jgi:hypothetical protein
MSVNAINAAEPQHKSSAGAAIGTGLVLGAAGVGAGYLFGGKRPSLEELIKNSEKDTFTRTAVTELDADAAGKLAAAKAEYQAAGTDELKTLRQKNKAVTRLVEQAAVENSAELETNITNAQTKLAEKEVTIGDKQYKLADIKAETQKANADLKTAKANLAAAGDNATDEMKTAVTNAEEAVTKAKNNAKAFKDGAKEELENVTKARKALYDARVASFENLAANDGAHKTAKTAATEAEQAFSTIKGNKLKTILENEENVNAYKKVAKAFEKVGQKKAALIYGGIAAAVGVIAGAILGGGKKEA